MTPAEMKRRSQASKKGWVTRKRMAAVRGDKSHQEAASERMLKETAERFAACMQRLGKR